MFCNEEYLLEISTQHTVTLNELKLKYYLINWLGQKDIFSQFLLDLTMILFDYKLLCIFYVLTKKRKS